MMSYRAISYLLCTFALIFGSGIVSADDLFPFDQAEFLDDFQEPFFSTIFAFDETMSMEELLETWQTDVELTEEEFILAEAVFANAITNQAEIQEFESPPQMEEELPIAPTSLEAEEIPMFMRQLAVVDQDSVAVWPNVDSQAGLSAATASTIMQGSSAVMGGFSNIQFTQSLFTSGTNVFSSHFFSNPYRTHPPIVSGAYMTLTAFPQNVRPGELLTLSGRLQDQFGRPIAGAQVRILRTDERGWVTNVGNARTDFSGNYVFRTTATPGVFWFRSEYLQMPGLVTRGQSNAVRVASISYQNWEVALTAVPTVGYIGDTILLYGFVLSDGIPVGSGRPVELQFQHSGKWYRIAQRPTDVQGIFAYPLQAVAPGTIIVRAIFTDPYGVQKVSNSVGLTIIGNPTPFIPLPGNTGLTLYARSQNLQSFGSTSVFGWLSTSSGMPLAGMPIIITSDMRQGNSAPMRSTEQHVTGADGSFELPVVASQGSGTIAVQASFPGSGQFSAAESRPLTITFGSPGPIPTQPSSVNRQVQITAQYSPANPKVGEDVTVLGTLTTVTGQPVSGVLISGVATIQSGVCQATSRNTINTDVNGNYRYTFQPSCEGEAQVTIGFDGTTQFRPVSVSFTIPVGRTGPIPMGPIVMMSAP